MATKLKTVRATTEEWQSWSAAALLAGLPFNRWIRRALTERAQLESALERERLKHERG